MTSMYAVGFNGNCCSYIADATAGTIGADGRKFELKRLGVPATETTPPFRDPFLLSNNWKIKSSIVTKQNNNI